MDKRIIKPPIKIHHVKSSNLNIIDKAVQITADNGTNKETVIALTDFIAQALAVQQIAVQTTPKKTTCKISKNLKEMILLMKN